MKLHSVAEKIAPLVAAILLMLSHANYVTKQMHEMSLLNVVLSGK
jgi:hypothetical protein